jgi:hypothetical protein
MQITKGPGIAFGIRTHQEEGNKKKRYRKKSVYEYRKKTKTSENAIGQLKCVEEHRR